MHLSVLVLIFGAIFGGFYYLGKTIVPLYYVAIAFGVTILYILVLYFFDFVRPLKIVMAQMQTLLSGKPYKRIYTERIDEVGILAHFFNQVTKGLGEVSYDIKDRERMLGELDLAASLQREILPLENPNIPGLQIVAKNKPATEIGGDSFDYFQAGDKFYIYIGDVTGHGVAGGLIMSMVNSMISIFAEISPSPYDILVKVNKGIKRHVKKTMFMTLVMLCWDQKQQKMSYVGAGHEHILVYRAATGECEAILSGGVALGMVPDNSKVISEKPLILNSGDLIVLYTDGITEAKNRDDEMFGLENLKKSVIEFAPNYSAEGVNYHIAQEVSSFMGDAVQADDITLITIKKEAGNISDAAIKDKSTKWSI